MLLYKEGAKMRDLYCAENNAVIGTHVIAFKLITETVARGRAEIYYVVGCYIPLLDTDGTTRKTIKHALKTRPKGLVPLVVGDLNTNLDFSQDRQEAIHLVGDGQARALLTHTSLQSEGGGGKANTAHKGTMDMTAKVQQ